ncbi:MAG: hypothetical protein K8W52_44220 [Deltaproteobacteria bacterium]|nr:hypothetical protein [Deltaproteobacteria bacterium]
MRAWLSLIPVSLLVACGGAPLDPGSGDELGTGSMTLSVEGTASAEARIANASSENDFDTAFDIRIQKGGADVATGTVTVTSNGGTVALTHDGNGRWRGTQGGYFEAYQLDVTSGTDTLSGVIVDGPDLHTISAPTAGATVDATMPLPVGWARNDHADLATIQTKGIDPVTIDDSGSYSLAAGTLKSKKDQAETETVELRRSDRVSPAGAIAGSSFAVSIRNHVDIVVMPNPNAP